MNRDDFLAQIEAAAVQPRVTVHELPESGIKIHLRKPNRFHIQRAFTAAGDDDDAHILGITGLIKFCLVDEDGKAIPRHFDEARAWLNSLPDDDLAFVMERIGEMISEADEEGDPEAPKGS